MKFPLRTTFSISQHICVVILLLGWSFSVTCFGQTDTAPQNTQQTEKDDEKQPEEESEVDKERFAQLRLFAEALDQIDRHYVTEVDRRELVEAAIDGMLAKLDPFSDFIPPEELSQFRGSVESEFAGVGIHVVIEDGFLSVISPIHGSPAWRGGIIAGDKIVKINNLDAEGITMDDAIKLIKGKIGTTVRLTVRHRAGDKEEEIELERARVRVPTVLGDRLNDEEKWEWFYSDNKASDKKGDKKSDKKSDKADDNETDNEIDSAKEKIAYIRLTSFSRRTVMELVPVLQKLKKENVKGLVLDLRYNPGGLLPIAIQTCDLFVDEGDIVSTKGRAARTRLWEAREDDMFPQVPMAVLVNEYSASASEIVAACLKDNKRAVIVGERTFGKGSVQNVIDMEDGKSILKLTTAAYYRPNGTNIHRAADAKDEDEWGVHPSEGFAVEMDDEQSAAYLKYRRQRDVFGKTTDDNTDDTESNEAFEDKQLEKAIDYIRSKVK